MVELDECYSCYSVLFNSDCITLLKIVLMQLIVHIQTLRPTVKYDLQLQSPSSETESVKAPVLLAKWQD